MVYLIMAITSSMLVSVILRVSEKHIRNNTSMLAANYLMCMVLAAICTETWNLFPVFEQGFPFSVGLGVISGMFYLGSFMLLQWNIRENGVVLSSVFMKLGVLVPTLMSILVFGEIPQAFQVMGMVIAVCAILLINMDGKGEKAKNGWGLVFLLLAGGATDAMSKVFEELGVAALKNQFLLYTFIVAFIMCVLVCKMNGQGLTKEDALFGLLIGVPNYCSARFLLLSMADLPAVIVYPTYSVATIVLVTIVGVAAFKEKLSRRQKTAMMMIFAALILLNI